MTAQVVRWERDWSQPAPQPYIPVSEYPIACMCTVSSHDSETVSQWWQSHPEESAVYAAHLGLVKPGMLPLAVDRDEVWFVPPCQQYC